MEIIWEEGADTHSRQCARLPTRLYLGRPPGSLWEGSKPRKLRQLQFAQYSENPAPSHGCKMHVSAGHVTVEPLKGTLGDNKRPKAWYPG
eukprot:697896-Pelagomonas_calceolata.AAC.1